MTEMESPLEDYADGLGFHFDSYFIWRLFYRRIGDALSNRCEYVMAQPHCSEAKLTSGA